MPRASLPRAVRLNLEKPNDLQRKGSAMRTVTFTLASFTLIAALVFSSGCATGSSNRVDRSSLDDAGPITADTVTLVVHGMGCPLCANNVDKQLLAVPGVSDVRIDLGDGTVLVTLDEHNRPTRSQLARAVDDSGFTLVSIQAD
jgi:copper chaperone